VAEAVYGENNLRNMKARGGLKIMAAEEKMKYQPSFMSAMAKISMAI
jgi:hypothetical protein